MNCEIELNSLYSCTAKCFMLILVQIARMPLNKQNEKLKCLRALFVYSFLSFAPCTSRLRSALNELWCFVQVPSKCIWQYEISSYRCGQATRRYGVFSSTVCSIWFTVNKNLDNNKKKNSSYSVWTSSENVCEWWYWVWW